jgi:hypothetical protein
VGLVPGIGMRAAPGFYQVGTTGACLPGSSQIDTLEACEAAVVELGVLNRKVHSPKEQRSTTTPPAVNATVSQLPLGCYLEPVAVSDRRMFPDGRMAFYNDIPLSATARGHMSICLTTPMAIVAASGWCQAYEFRSTRGACRMFPKPVARINGKNNCECWSQ